MKVTSVTQDFVLFTSLTGILLWAVNGKALLQAEDYSPYCKDLAQVDSICSSLTAIFICGETCQNAEDKNNLTCGKRYSSLYRHDRRKRRLSKRIVGGRPSDEGAWPWQVSLLLRGKQYCAGAVLTPDWIVTAAHCFGDYSSLQERDWEVVLGEHHLYDREVFEQRRKVKKFIIHQKNYRFWPDGIMIPDIYDIALVKLDHPAKYTKWVSPICLPNNAWSFVGHHDCKIAGWGHTSYKGKQPDILREATVKLVPRDICNLPLSYNGTIHKSSICAGFAQGGVDACQYDSGGALSCPHKGTWFLQGVISWGYQCALPNKYGVYANIPYLKKWILGTILSYDPVSNTFSSRLPDLLEKAQLLAHKKKN